MDYENGTIRYYPLLSVTIRYYPLLSVTIRYFPALLCVHVEKTSITTTKSCINATKHVGVKNKTRYIFGVNGVLIQSITVIFASTLQNI